MSEMDTPVSRELVDEVLQALREAGVLGDLPPEDAPAGESQDEAAVRRLLHQMIQATAPDSGRVLTLGELLQGLNRAIDDQRKQARPGRSTPPADGSP